MDSVLPAMFTNCEGISMKFPGCWCAKSSIVWNSPRELCAVERSIQHAEIVWVCLHCWKLFLSFHLASKEGKQYIKLEGIKSSPPFRPRVIDVYILQLFMRMNRETIFRSTQTEDTLTMLLMSDEAMETNSHKNVSNCFKSFLSLLNVLISCWHCFLARSLSPPQTSTCCPATMID